MKNDKENPEKVTSAMQCDYWAKDLCQCNYLKDCKINKALECQAPLSNETNINKIDMSDVPASPANEYYSEQGKRMFDRAKVSNETKVVESIEQKHMTIVDQVRTQVEDHTDHVSDFFIKVAGNFEGKNPHVEVQDFTNSETRLSCLKLHDKTEAFVIEKRTELNNCEYTFIQKTYAVKLNQSIQQSAKEYASESLPHEKGFLAGVSYIIKIINNEKITLERQSDKEQFSQFSRVDEKIDVLNHILKLIQP